MIQNNAFFLVTTLFFSAKLLNGTATELLDQSYPTHSMHDDLDGAIAAAKFAQDKKADEYSIETLQDPATGAYAQVKDKMLDKPYFANVPVCRYTVHGKDFTAKTFVTWNRGTVPAELADRPAG